MVLVILAVEPDRWPGLGPVTLLPLMMYIHEPSALNVTSCGSYAVGMSAVTTGAAPASGMTAIELAPVLTAYSVVPSRESVTDDVLVPVYFTRGRRAAGARASIS